MKSIRYTFFSALVAVQFMPLSGQAIELSGFADGRLTITDESRDPTPGSGAQNPVENQLTANAELDISQAIGAVSLRTDIDLNLSGATDAAGNALDSAGLEQALISWQADGDTRIQAGVFNNPLGQDAEDIVDRRFSSHSAVYAVLDEQTAEFRGNNIAGIEVAGRIGDVGMTLGAINDIGKRSGTKAEGKTSLLFDLGYTPDELPGLTLEAGVLSQEEYNATTNPKSAGTLYDLNAEYAWHHKGHAGAVGFDYLIVSDIVDIAYDVWFECAPRPAYALGLRFGGVSWDQTIAGSNADDNTVATVYLAYRPTPLLSLALELRDGSANANKTLNGSLNQGELTAISGISEGTQAVVDIVAKF